MLMERATSSLLVVDVQDRLVPAMSGRDGMEQNVAVLLQSAARLDVPVLVSEQYPKGLGRTVSGLTGLFRDDVVIEKMAFSCVQDETWKMRFDALARSQAVICGIESHVCVLQTAMQLSESGADVFVVSDAVASRSVVSKEAALSRMRDAGIRIVTTEMVVFEWLGKAGSREFKELSALIK